MQEKKKSLADYWYEQEEKDIERAIETLKQVEIKKRDFMLKKLYILSLENELYIPKCDFCGEYTKVVPIECAQPDVYAITCCKCARHQELVYRDIDKIYKLNRKIIDKFGDKKPKCKHCNGESEVAFFRDSNGGSFGLICKNCGKHIH